ncbi:MAG: hypothetical protein P8107_09275 [Spirochaetia bacterium]
MENLDLSEKDLIITRLGKPGVDSPLGLSTHYGDFIANYVEEDASVVLQPFPDNGGRRYLRRVVPGHKQ